MSAGRKTGKVCGAVVESRCCILELTCFLYAVMYAEKEEVFFMQANRLTNHQKIVRLVVCAMLTALGVVLGGLLSIPAMPFGSYTLKIGFGVLPVIIAGVLYGPGYGAIVGALCDLLQALIFPKGAYMPWFTVVGALFGLIPGLFFIKRQTPTFLRILLAVAVGQIVGSVICNTLLVIWLYGSPWQIVYARIINQAVMIPLYSALVYLCMKVIAKTKMGKALV